MQEKQLLEKCKALIEQKLQWGDNSIWSNKEFESLSEKIFEKTNIKLSVTTLKRILGKVKYENAFNSATLDTLVQYLGYENWLNFRQQSNACSHSTGTVIGTAEEQTIRIDYTTYKKRPLSRIVTLAGIIGAVLIFCYFYYNHSKVLARLSGKNFKLENNKLIENPSDFERDSTFNKTKVPTRKDETKVKPPNYLYSK